METTHHLGQLVLPLQDGWGNSGSFVITLSFLPRSLGYDFCPFWSPLGDAGEDS